MIFKVQGKTFNTTATPITLNSLPTQYVNGLFNVTISEGFPSPADILKCSDIVLSHYGDRQVEYLYDATNEKEKLAFQTIFNSRFRDTVQLYASTLKAIRNKQEFLDYKQKATQSATTTNTQTQLTKVNSQSASHGKVNGTSNNTDSTTTGGTSANTQTGTQSDQAHNEQFTINEKYAMVDQGGYQHNQPIQNPESRVVSKGGNDSTGTSSTTQNGTTTGTSNGTSENKSEQINTADSTAESTQNGTNTANGTQNGTNTNEGLNQAEFKLIFEYANAIMNLDIVSMVITNMAEMFSNTIRITIEREVYNPWDSTF